MSAVMAIDAIYPVKYDFKRLFDELREFGWTPYKVAITLCVEPPLAYSWATGAEPRHGYGAALLVLHRTVCGSAYSEKLNKDAKLRA